MNNFSPFVGDGNGLGWFFGELGDKIFEVGPNHILCMVCEFRSEEFREFLSGCPRCLGVERVDALVEGFVVDRDINVLGKTSDRAIDFGQGGAALKGHRKTSGHREESLEHPADPNVLLQVLRSPAEFSGACL